MIREEKRKKVLRLSDQDIKDVVYTIERQFDVMKTDEKKAILKKLGVAKNDIEKLDEVGMKNTIKKEYNNILPRIDLNNFKVDEKYKTVNEFISKKNPEKLKKEIEEYKKL